IEALAARGAAAPEGAEIVDVGGRYAIPGLIDTHVHVTIQPDEAAMRAEMERNLYGGVTAVRDMIGDARIIAHFARNARLGELASPDIYFAGLAAGPGFFADDRMTYEALGATPGAVPWMRAVTPQTNLTELVAMMRGAGASGVKIYANLSPEIVRALTAEARRQGLPVWAHGAIFPTTPLQAVEAGADTLSHVCMLAYQTLTPPPASYDYADRGPLDEARLMGDPVPEMAALWAAMRERGVVLDTTAWVYRTIERMRAEMTAAAAPGEPEFLPPIYCSSRLAEHLMGQASRAGVLLSAGTDAPAIAGDPWPGIFEELMLMRDSAGIAPIAVLRAATVNGARAIGGDEQSGTIAVGALANFALLTEDPLAERANLRTVELTVKRGRRYWRRDYIATGAAM
ncbi:MAG: amidohydrolase family protein, partial [Sphingomonadaceae bacterium]|nr:amidohydrolase family protein [Sphingomonadaceae bacterium]